MSAYQASFFTAVSRSREGRRCQLQASRWEWQLTLTLTCPYSATKPSSAPWNNCIPPPSCGLSLPFSLQDGDGDAHARRLVDITGQRLKEMDE